MNFKIIGTWLTVSFLLTILLSILKTGKASTEDDFLVENVMNDFFVVADSILASGEPTTSVETTTTLPSSTTISVTFPERSTTTTVPTTRTTAEIPGIPTTSTPRITTTEMLIKVAVEDAVKATISDQNVIDGFPVTTSIRLNANAEAIKAYNEFFNNMEQKANFFQNKIYFKLSLCKKI